MVLVDKGIAENSKWCHRTRNYGDLSELASSRWRGSEEQYQHCNILASLCASKEFSTLIYFSLPIIIRNCFQRPDVEQDKVAYTYSSYIPTLLRTILSRRHDISREDAVLLSDVLMHVLSIIVGKIGPDEVSNRTITMHVGQQSINCAFFFSDHQQMRGANFPAYTTILHETSPVR